MNTISGLDFNSMKEDLKFNISPVGANNISGIVENPDDDEELKVESHITFE
jgi:hypothetical protein